MNKGTRGKDYPACKKVIDVAWQDPKPGGGAAKADGGAAKADGGAAKADGGAAKADGGAAKADGGAAKADGGAAKADGGAAKVDGGAAKADGGAAKADGGEPKVAKHSKAYTQALGYCVLVSSTNTSGEFCTPWALLARTRRIIEAARQEGAGGFAGRLSEVEAGVKTGKYHTVEAFAEALRGAIDSGTWQAVLPMLRDWQNRAGTTLDRSTQTGAELLGPSAAAGAGAAAA